MLKSCIERVVCVAMSVLVNVVWIGLIRMGQSWYRRGRMRLWWVLWCWARLGRWGCFMLWDYGGWVEARENELYGREWMKLLRTRESQIAMCFYLHRYYLCSLESAEKDISTYTETTRKVYTKFMPIPFRVQQSLPWWQQSSFHQSWPWSQHHWQCSSQGLQHYPPSRQSTFP